MSEKELIAPERFKIVDPHNINTVFVDWVVTSGEFEGVVNITLGTVDHSLREGSDDLPRIVVSSRLRLSKGFAERLYAALGNSLGRNEEVQTQQTPPKNQIN